MWAWRMTVSLSQRRSAGLPILPVGRTGARKFFTSRPRSTIRLAAQIPNPTQQPSQNISESTPIFRVEVAARATQAVNYLHRGGSTRIIERYPARVVS
jgi:hypothetical protein